MCRQGDILLIPFPYSDLSATKKCPILVLSNSSYNVSHHDLIVATITSKKSVWRRILWDYLVNSSKAVSKTCLTQRRMKNLQMSMKQEG
ncbi:type II toxin-antitoxin system PemK/MazF family toxin [Paenibacillus sp. S3N08]|uniref:Type II toxin-antitoxin system PemK/MazF family toxin n=2 Tax=Paenibacillus agricola TaxID=2716264 RepID=A0ABX0J790_9BACL|nr:type II toxin-antitoxin system PemK/MazF family toxin [Paenibacillus agricola]